MSNFDPRIDKYVGDAASFAQPILTHLRQMVHKACPKVQETMKWSFPHFDYHGILCSMAAFKQHCSFGFWKADLILPKTQAQEEAMGHFGRITSLKDLPADKALLGYIKEAARLNEEGVKLPPRKRSPAGRKELVVPDDLASALKKNSKARAAFDGFSYSHKKEYVEWLTEAKRPETREKRLAQTLEMLVAGKSRYWKYDKC